MERTTTRLRIDALRVGDARTLFQYRADPRVSRYQGWQPSAFEDALGFIEAAAPVAPDTPGSWYQRALRLLDSGELVGDLGLHFPADAERTVEIGISLAPQHHRRGLACEALCEALDYIFGALGKHRVIASVDLRNEPCIALLRKLGMRQEAHFRESLWLGNEWVDDVVFAVLAREWRAAHAPECHHG